MSGLVRQSIWVEGLGHFNSQKVLLKHGSSEYLAAEPLDRSAKYRVRSAVRPPLTSDPP